MSAVTIEGTRLTVALRSGATFPDWSAIASQTARDALVAIFEVVSIERRWRNLRAC